MRASTSKHHMTDDGWMTMLFQISNLKMHDDRISNQQDDDDDDVAIVRSRAVDGRSVDRSFVRSVVVVSPNLASSRYVVVRRVVSH